MQGNTVKAIKGNDHPVIFMWLWNLDPYSIPEKKWLNCHSYMA